MYVFTDLGLGSDESADYSAVALRQRRHLSTVLHCLLRVPKILLLRLSESTKYCMYVRNSTSNTAYSLQVTGLRRICFAWTACVDGLRGLKEAAWILCGTDEPIGPDVDRECTPVSPYF